MSKISFRGQLPIGTQDHIRLKTIKGQVGYKITKFQILPGRPGLDDCELVCKIFTKTQTGAISAVVNFTESDMIGAAYYANNSTYSFQGQSDAVLFDNSVTNQDIFVTMDDASSNTNPANYYIELETMKLSDLETTKLTLQSLRTISS